MQGMALYKAVPNGSSLALPFHIFPGRVAKQIMCMFASVCGPGLFKEEPALTRFVLNGDHRGIPSKFRLYCFLMSRDSGANRQAGLTGLMSGLPGAPGTEVHMFAEIAFPPFGYILTVESRPNDRALTDITFFAQSGYQEFRSLHLPLPTRAVNSYFPGDFRTAEEWNAAIDKRLSAPDEETAA
jgi:hypothetical protein